MHSSNGDGSSSALGVPGHPSVEDKIVMDDGPGTEMLAAHIDLNAQNAALPCLKARRREAWSLTNQDPDVKSWTARLIGGKKLGCFDTVSQTAAGRIVMFGLG